MPDSLILISLICAIAVVSSHLFAKKLYADKSFLAGNPLSYGKREVAKVLCPAVTVLGVAIGFLSLFIWIVVRIVISYQ